MERRFKVLNLFFPIFYIFFTYRKYIKFSLISPQLLLEIMVLRTTCSISAGIPFLFMYYKRKIQIYTFSRFLPVYRIETSNTPCSFVASEKNKRIFCRKGKTVRRDITR